jgi:hypothetical protein
MVSSIVFFKSNVYKSVMDTRLKHSFTCQIAGFTESGNSVFTIKLINEVEEMITPVPEIVFHCYGEYQKLFSDYLQVTFRVRLPDNDQFVGKKELH